MKFGNLGVWFFFDGLSSPDSAEAAQRIESLGYSILWIPETVGKNPMVLASWLLANTKKLIVATGIANIYHRGAVWPHNTYSHENFSLPKKRQPLFIC